MKAKINTGDWLANAHARLLAVSPTPGLEARVLLAYILDKSQAWVIAHPETNLISGQINSLDNILQRRLAGEPLPYLLGYWEFYTRRFSVSPEVLIPRPETEILVEKALSWLHEHPSRRFAADIGTGSGCIAVSLAASIHDIQVLASDCSRAALLVARQNCYQHLVQNRIHLLQTYLLTGVAAKFDLVCANLPYIPTSTLLELDVARHEPRQAIDGGEDGLKYIRSLLEEIPPKLAPGGLLLLEIEARQGQIVTHIAYQVFPSAEIQLFNDYAGKPRLVQVVNLTG